MSLKRSFAVLVGAGAIAQLCMFAGMLMLARLYTPEAFGRYGVYAGIASVVAIVSGLRFDYLAFSDRAKKYDPNDFYLLTIISAIVFGLASFCIVLIGKKWLPPFQNIEWWIFLFVLSSSFFSLGSQAILMRRKYHAFAKLRFWQVIFQVSSSLVLFRCLPNDGLNLGFSGSQLFFGALIFIWFARRLEYGNLRRIFDLWKKFRAEAITNSLISLMQYSTPFAPTLFGTMFYSAAEVGAYFVFSQIFAAPLSIFRRSFINILNAEFSNPKRFAEILHRHKRALLAATGVLLGSLFLTSAGVEIFGAGFIDLMLGERWLPYLSLLVPLALYFLMDCLLQPLSTLLPLWGKVKGSLFLEAVRAICIYGGGFLVAMNFEIGYVQFLYLFIGVMCLTYIAQALYVILVARRADFNNLIEEA